ncbi:hypothetical protein [Roseibacillus persicicus]|uniref:hypothetical protein n=1 Tax=Roseibacillus persicicus TaxID=454148 RepID=UPI0016744860|nr:hypothetical protein [Roseibacillus persicicus]MDQ8189402.1 hypothetical protein [Roseibacillus persicicus]
MKPIVLLAVAGFFCSLTVASTLNEEKETAPLQTPEVEQIDFEKESPDSPRAFHA